MGVDILLVLINFYDKMIKIAHKGNIEGKSKFENCPEYIDKSLEKGFDIELDVGVYGNQLYLGHDTKEYLIDINWLLERSKNLWCHAKNFKALDLMLNYKELNCFWHQEDNYTITSKGFVWAYPGFPGSKSRTIAVKPDINWLEINEFYGVCLDDFSRLKL